MKGMLVPVSMETDHREKEREKDRDRERLGPDAGQQSRQLEG